MPKDAGTSLAEAAASFLSRLERSERVNSQTELNKFVYWCGRGRAVSELTVEEVARYAQEVATTTSLGDPMKRLVPVRAFLLYARKAGLLKTNLAVHLRAKKVFPGRQTPSRKIPQEATSLTQEGKAKLEAELQELKAGRVHIAEEINLAMADKDFRENAPLDAAKDRQGQVEARIRELETTLSNVSLIEAKEAKVTRLSIGSTVILRDLETSEEVRYTLVSSSEVNPILGRISVASPTGKALLERAEGEIVGVSAPMGTLRYRIEKIEN